MGFYRLKPKVGGHIEGETSYVSGDIVESDRDLAAKHPTKFEKVHDIPSNPKLDKPLQAAERAVSPEVVKEAAEEAVDTTKIKSILGKNVTEHFPVALAAELLVLKRGVKFRVADPDMPDRSLTAKGMTKDELTAWLAANAV